MDRSFAAPVAEHCLCLDRLAASFSAIPTTRTNCSHFERPVDLKSTATTFCLDAGSSSPRPSWSGCCMSFRVVAWDSPSCSCGAGLQTSELARFVEHVSARPCRETEATGKSRDNIAGRSRGTGTVNARGTLIRRLLVVATFCPLLARAIFLPTVCGSTTLRDCGGSGRKPERQGNKLLDRKPPTSRQRQNKPFPSPSFCFSFSTLLVEETPPRQA